MQKSAVGGVLRINNTLAFSFNQAKSYRLSMGDGGDGYVVGSKQGIPFGQGRDIGVRPTLLGGKLELNSTYYNNYQPNARITPLGSAQQNVKDELAAIFPSTFYNNGTDVQKITTKGVACPTFGEVISHRDFKIAGVKVGQASVYQSDATPCAR